MVGGRVAGYMEGVKDKRRKGRIGGLGKDRIYEGGKVKLIGWMH